MKRFIYSAFVAFWASILSIWGYAMLAADCTGGAPDDNAADRQVTAAELARHAEPGDCWMAIDGVVYDFSAYIPLHPAPPIVMTQWCGREASEAYHTKGYGRPHSPAADTLLPPYRVGVLVSGDDTEGEG
jgi:cytochrome b involved in lipid metabolism